MLTEAKEAALLENAKAEEAAYNWMEAVKLYEQVSKSYLDKKMTKEAAEIFKKLGYAYYRAAYTVETSEEYLIKCKRAINAYKEAADLFRQTGDKPEELECEAEIFYTRGDIVETLMEVREMLNKSIDLFMESSGLYSKEDDQKSCARTLSRAAMASYYLSSYYSEGWEIQQVIQKGREISGKAWKTSKEIGNIQYIVESLTAETFISLLLS